MTNIITLPAADRFKREAALDRNVEALVDMFLELHEIERMGILEAVKEIGSREDIVDVLSQDETTSSLLRGMLGPWDFSDIEELAEFF